MPPGAGAAGASWHGMAGTIAGMRASPAQRPRRILAIRAFARSGQSDESTSLTVLRSLDGGRNGARSS